MTTAIFINPVVTSKIYTFFGANANTTILSLTTVDGAEPQLADLQGRVTVAATDDHLVFIIPEGLTTVFANNAHVNDFRGYVGTLGDTADVVYTNTFLDNCFNQSTIATQPTTAAHATMTNYVFRTTTDPSGLAIAGTKAKVTEVLTAAAAKPQLSASGKIAAVFREGTKKAITSVPLLMPYNIELIVEPTDALRSYHCKIENTVGDDHNVENLGLFWFAAGAALVVLLVWLASYKFHHTGLVRKY